jgi:hypothetical protein
MSDEQNDRHWSSSPILWRGRGLRVVYEIECHSPGTLAVICLHSVVFPLPDGAEIMNKMPRRT